MVGDGHLQGMVGGGSAEDREMVPGTAQSPETTLPRKDGAWLRRDGRRQLSEMAQSSARERWWGVTFQPRRDADGERWSIARDS